VYCLFYTHIFFEQFYTHIYVPHVFDTFCKSMNTTVVIDRRINLPAVELTTTFVFVEAHLN
jgi:hypothetical protein